MYLTAHQVRSRQEGRVGINAFLNLHRDQPIPLRRSHEPDIDAVAQLAGGYPVAEAKQVEPGGNDVIAYLDLVAPDAVSEIDLQAALSVLKSRVGSTPLPMVINVGGVGARFGAAGALETEKGPLEETLSLLSQSVLALLPHRNDPPRRVSGPFVAWASAGADGIRLWLPPVTLLRVPQSPARRMRMLVPRDLLHSGPTLDLLREAALALLGLGEGDLRREGGVEIVDPRTGKTLARYDMPRAS